jgi:glycine cleavage system aminomethyltransferase T
MMKTPENFTSYDYIRAAITGLPLPKQYFMEVSIMAESNQKLESFAYVPKYPDIKLYAYFFGDFRVWEADDWKSTSLSWKKSCYIHAGISSPEIRIKGPDAQKLLSMASINNVYKWKIGTSKHLVMCNEDGFIENHALANRDDEESFRMFAGNP